LGCSLANTAAILGFFVTQTNWSYPEKILMIAIATMLIHEPEVHLYKAKRFFVQKYEIVKLELQAIESALQKKF
jgi:hypothetical protein